MATRQDTARKRRASSDLRELSAEVNVLRERATTPAHRHELNRRDFDNLVAEARPLCSPDQLTRLEDIVARYFATQAWGKIVLIVPLLFSGPAPAQAQPAAAELRAGVALADAPRHAAAAPHQPQAIRAKSPDTFFETR